MNNIKPLKDRVVVKPKQAEEKTASGIVLPSSANNEQPQQGEVVAVGEKQKSVKVGDNVLFKSYSPAKIKISNQEIYILEGDDILAVIK